jgi:hypothetical protein
MFREILINNLQVALTTNDELEDKVQKFINTTITLGNGTPADYMSQGKYLPTQSS